MKNLEKRWFGVVIFICLAVVILSCERQQKDEKEVSVAPVEKKVVSRPVKEKEGATPVEEKKAIPPVKEEKVSASVKVEVITELVEEETVPSVNWENRYGPDGEDKIIAIGNLYIVKDTDNAGTGRNAVMTWDEAMNWAANLDWLGKKDWRLPTQIEMKMIYRNKEMLGAYEAGEYWVSTLHPRIPAQAAVTVNYGNGGGRYRDKAGKHYIRAVRP